MRKQWGLWQRATGERRPQAALIKDAIQAKRMQAYDTAIAKWQEVLQLTPAHQRANKEIERLTQLNERKQQGAMVLQQLAMRLMEIQPVFADIAAILNQADKRADVK